MRMRSVVACCARVRSRRADYENTILKMKHQHCVFSVALAALLTALATCQPSNLTPGQAATRDGSKVRNSRPPSSCCYGSSMHGYTAEVHLGLQHCYSHADKQHPSIMQRCSGPHYCFSAECQPASGQWRHLSLLLSHSTQTGCTGVPGHCRHIQCRQFTMLPEQPRTKVSYITQHMFSCCLL